MKLRIVTGNEPFSAPEYSFDHINPIGHQHDISRLPFSLKIPYTDGTTQVQFEPLDFISRLGSIEEGKCAGMIVLNHNLFEILLTDIHKTKVRRTLFKGEVVYEAQ